jgi:hypothetical protein
VSISGRGIVERKNRITDEYVTGILALGKKFEFASRPSGKSKNWREKNVPKSNFFKLLFSGGRRGCAHRVHY